MDGVKEIWIARDGQKYGPYRAEHLVAWLAEGKLGADTLAWHAGLPEWASLSAVLDAGAAAATPPPPPPPSAPMASNPFDSFYRSRASSASVDRASMPPPPSLHWFLVALLSGVTFGLFGWIWGFVQAGWIKKIDRNSNAITLLAIGLVCGVVGGVVYGMNLAAPSATAALLMFVLYIASCVLYLVAMFSMAGSLRREAHRLDIPLDISGITLFFFNVYYLQGVLSWVGRWRTTGQSRPGAPIAVFWVLMAIFPCGLAILAAIAIPAYQDYVIRSQVAEGVVLADGVKIAVAEFYQSHGSLPTNNAEAGLGEPAAIKGQYVTGVDVERGQIFVIYNEPRSNQLIKGKALVLTPTVSNGTISWQCSGTMAAKYMPAMCRA